MTADSLKIQYIFNRNEIPRTLRDNHFIVKDIIMVSGWNGKSSSVNHLFEALDV